ncbi:MAG: MBOAT family protein [Clostridia bacterium]|nr:MBOAT family protein [Clostridia bacterium]MBN2883546.1 MBOAT family protein [Clostridia bacterium]
MVFSSLIFLFAFLPLLLGSYAVAKKLIGLRAGNLVLLVGSFIFIFWGSGKDTIVLIAVILINYIAGLFLNSKKWSGKSYKKIVLIIAIVLSIVILAYFKYAGFFSYNATRVLGLFNISWTVPVFLKNVILPLGISFYTFQALSYTIDVYWENVEPTKNLLDFSLYVSFFPQLIAGPIVRYKDIHTQLKNRVSGTGHIYEGIMRFMMGMSKKVLLANIVAKAADGIFILPVSELHASLAWIGLIAYTLQMYLDFSAYSDMAIGLAKMLGFDLLENFNLPYISQSVREFWKRWHISLSSWLRDYLYIPLGGNRKGKVRTYLNLLVVYVICGLWHGAAWTFIFWGIITGFFLMLEKAFLGNILKKIPRVFRHIYTMLVFMIGLVFFRGANIKYAFSYIKVLFFGTNAQDFLRRVPGEFLQNDVIVAMVLGIMSSIGVFAAFRKKCDKKGALWQNIFTAGVILAFLLSIVNLYGGAYNPFIYFRF